MHCPITGVHLSRLLLSSILAFAFIFGFEFVFHGIFLKPQYLASAELWRTPEDMQAYYAYGIVAQLAVSLLVVFTYAFIAREHSVGMGLRYGLLMGLVFGVSYGAMIVYQPIPVDLAAYWFGGLVFEFLVIGLIAGLFYKDPEKKGS